MQQSAVWCDRLGGSRRDFLKTAAATCLVVPACVVGRGEEPAPSSRLNIAAIGCGGKGEGDVAGVAAGNNIVALCDVDARNAQGSFKRFPDARRFTDFRRMFDAMERSIDAVTISTPDHMHFAAAWWAIQRGKHVLVQKPLTHSMWEARQLTLAASEKKVVSKMGNQGQASEETRRTIELLRGGAIGVVTEVHVWTNRPIWLQGADRPAGSDTAPAELDWEAWLGLAPARPFVGRWPDDHPARKLASFKQQQVYHPFVWRGWWDFGTGALGDIACHAVNPFFWALEDVMRGPFSVEAETGPWNAEMFPEWSIIRYRFKRPDGKPDLQFVWYDGGKQPPRPPELEAERDWPLEGGSLCVGDKGKLLGTRLIPETQMQAYAPHAPPPTLPRSPGHYEEWIAAIKGAPRVDNSFEHAGPLTELVLAGNVAIRAKKRLEWDPVKFAFTNAADANAYLRRAYRPGWV